MPLALFATGPCAPPRALVVHHPMRRLEAADAAAAVREALEHLVAMPAHEAEAGILKRAANAGATLDPRFEVLYQVRESTEGGVPILAHAPVWSGLHGEAVLAVGPVRAGILRVTRRNRLARRPRRGDDGLGR